jgi:hypothetical protein
VKKIGHYHLGPNAENAPSALTTLEIAARAEASPTECVRVRQRCLTAPDKSDRKQTISAKSPKILEMMGESALYTTLPAHLPKPLKTVLTSGGRHA